MSKWKKTKTGKIVYPEKRVRTWTRESILRIVRQGEWSIEEEKLLFLAFSWPIIPGLVKKIIIQLVFPQVDQVGKKTKSPTQAEIRASVFESYKIILGIIGVPNIAIEIFDTLVELGYNIDKELHPEMSQITY